MKTRVQLGRPSQVIEIERFMADFELHLLGIRGKQAGHDFFIVMCPLRLLPHFFRLDDDDIQPEFRLRRC